MKKNWLSISRCRCLHALPPVVFKTDRIPRFGARCWFWLVRRRDLGRSLFAAVFPEFIAREKPGQRGAGCQGRSAGLVRPAAVGEDSALRALTARHCGLRSREKAMHLGKDEERPMGQGLR